jgi:hypothetical protein
VAGTLSAARAKPIASSTAAECNMKPDFIRESAFIGEAVLRLVLHAS